MDSGAWQATAHGVAKSQTRLSDFTSALLTMPKPLFVWITTNWKILKEMGIPEHLTCLLRNLYVGQEATVRTGHGTTNKLVHIWEKSMSRLYIVTLLI